MSLHFPVKKDKKFWDNWFIGLAKYISSASKDPSTQTGAVIIGKKRQIISCGYNGFPIGVDDSEERYSNRELKYKIIVHCERNAIIFAERSLENCTLYTYPFMSCSTCASLVIQSGIKRCVAPPVPKHLEERWGEDMRLAKDMFREADVQLDIMEFPNDNKE